VLFRSRFFLFLLEPKKSAFKWYYHFNLTRFLLPDKGNSYFGSMTD